MTVFLIDYLHPNHADNPHRCPAWSTPIRSSCRAGRDRITQRGVPADQRFPGIDQLPDQHSGAAHAGCRVQGAGIRSVSGVPAGFCLPEVSRTSLQESC